jgi:surfactin synthase thioesterase subunit
MSPESADEELVDWMHRMGGTPPEILAEPWLLRLILGMMRADLSLLNSHWCLSDAVAA